MGGLNDDFELSDSAQEQLGVESDYSLIESEEENKDITTDEGTSDETTAGDEDGIVIVNADGTMSKKTTGKSANEDGDSGDDQDGTQDSDEEDTEQSESDKDDEGEESEEQFSDKVLKLVGEKYESEEEQEQLLDDLSNHAKFTKSNTEKAQKLADERQKLDGLIQKVSGDKVLQSLETIENQDDMDDFLESADDWFGSQDDNPIRQLLGAVKDSTPKAKEYSAEQQKLSEEQALVDTKKEIVDLQGRHERYKDEKVLNELADIADDKGITMVDAAEIYENSIHKKEMKTLSERVKNLEEDLKAAKEAKSKSGSQSSVGITGETGSGMTFRGANTHGDKPDFDSIEASVKEKLL